LAAFAALDGASVVEAAQPLPTETEMQAFSPVAANALASLVGGLAESGPSSPESADFADRLNASLTAAQAAPEAKAVSGAHKATSN
jgi:hypothetical protein